MSGAAAICWFSSVVVFCLDHERGTFYREQIHPQVGPHVPDLGRWRGGDGGLSVVAGLRDDPDVADLVDALAPLRGVALGHSGTPEDDKR